MLKYVLQQTKNGNVEAIVSKLNAIKSQLINTQGGGSLCLLLPDNEYSETYFEVLSKEWNACLAAVKRQEPIPVSEIANKWPFPVQLLDRFPDITKPTRIHVPISSSQATEVRIYIKCDLYRVPDLTSPLSFDQQLARLPAIGYYALSLLLDILDRDDGPLYVAIRGKGYAYGAYFGYQIWEDTLTFSCTNASDAPKAILAMQQLIKDMGQNWNKYVTEYEIGMAKSMAVYTNASSQVIPNDMLETCTEANFLGFKTGEQRNNWCSTHLAAVTNKDLRRVYDQYLSKMADPNYPSFTTLITPSDTEISPELGTFERRTLDSFIIPYTG